MTPASGGKQAIENTGGGAGATVAAAAMPSPMARATPGPSARPRGPRPLSSRGEPADPGDQGDHKPAPPETVSPFSQPARLDLRRRIISHPPSADPLPPDAAPAGAGASAPRIPIPIPLCQIQDRARVPRQGQGRTSSARRAAPAGHDNGRIPSPSNLRPPRPHCARLDQPLLGTVLLIARPAGKQPEPPPHPLGRSTTPGPGDSDRHRDAPATRSPLLASVASAGRPLTTVVCAPARPSIYADRLRPLRPGHLHRLHPAASRHATANQSRRSRAGPPIDRCHPTPPSLHGGPAVYLAGLVLGCVGTAALHSLDASTRAPLLRWSLGHRCLGAGAALAARVPVPTHSSARRLTPSVVAGLIPDSAATTPPSSGVPDLARDRLDHSLAAAICLIYATRPTWPVSCARLRTSREDCPRV
nr:formin-like protein 14 [Aegilops tauschii subsp. strangulata]